MKTAHTPGPWALSRIGNPYDHWAVYSETDSRGHNVATVEGGENARLIAAAPLLPDMAEALRKIRDEMLKRDDMRIAMDGDVNFVLPLCEAILARYDEQVRP